MSLIYCPECNHKISTNAKSCPKCGYTLTKKDIEKQTTVLCPECNSEVSSTLPTCPKCGYLLKKHFFPKLLLICIIILVVIVVFFLVATKKKAELEKRYAEFNGYYSDISISVDVFIKIKGEKITLYYFNNEDDTEYVKINGKIDFSNTNYGDEVSVNFEDVIYNADGDSSKDWGNVYLKAGDCDLAPSGKAITLKTTDNYILPTKLEIFFKITNEKFNRRISQ